MRKFAEKSYICYKASRKKQEEGEYYDRILKYVVSVISQMCIEPKFWIHVNLRQLNICFIVYYLIIDLRSVYTYVHIVDIESAQKEVG